MEGSVCSDMQTVARGLRKRMRICGRGCARARFAQGADSCWAVACGLLAGLLRALLGLLAAAGLQMRVLAAGLLGNCCQQAVCIAKSLDFPLCRVNQATPPSKLLLAEGCGWLPASALSRFCLLASRSSPGFPQIRPALLGHSLGHLVGMGVAEVAVGLGDQYPAVFVAYPGGYRLKIDAFFDGVADKVVPEAVMGEVGEGVELAGGVQGVLGVEDGDKGLIGEAGAWGLEAFQEALEDREEGNNAGFMVFSAVFAAGDGKAAALEVHIGQAEGVGLGFAHPGVGEEFNEVGGWLVADVQAAQGGQQLFKLLAGGDDNDRLAQTPANENLRGVIHDEPFALRVV